MSEPNVLIIRVLEACNAGCFMCPFAFSEDSYRFSVAEASALAEEVRGKSYRVVRLTGGEPLMVKELPLIIEAFKQAGLQTSVITNGWYLSERAGELADAGLDQVIVSLDGNCAETHDRFRRLPGLFERGISGSKQFRQVAPERFVRVNTVAGPHNFEQLPAMFQMFGELGIDHWSIIPLKREDGAWNYPNQERFKAAYAAFQTLVANSTKPRLIGDSEHWAGRNELELDRFLNRQVPFTPRGNCQLVDRLRYYVPQTGMVHPCNCVPHRIGNLEMAEQRTPHTFTSSGLLEARNWLRVNGPLSCKGCEPANAALGEGRIDVEAHPLDF